MPEVLGTCADPLQDAYDVLVLDLDGVVYVGEEAVSGAAEALNAAQAGGTHLAFITNNAARTPETVGGHLRSLGVEARDEDVVTSAQAAAHLLADDLEAGSRVFVIGGRGLEEALRERGLEPVATPQDGVAAVAQGYGPDLPWRQVVDGAIYVREGLPWVATNTDTTIPTARGLGPGNGTLVRLVAEYASREPRVAGKPETPLLEETMERVGGRRPLMVGDRLDTDIEGARRMGWDSLLVLTGVTGLAELVAATPDRRPTYLAGDLSALADPQPAVQGWRIEVRDSRLLVDGDGAVTDWWRAVATAAWAHLDDTGEPVLTEDVHPPR